MKRSSGSSPSSGSGSHETASVSRTQAYTIERLHRRQLRDAPYNPRIVDDWTREKLKKGLRKVGLLAPITWNRRTGHIVGGHQRIAAMDAIEGTDDYSLDVAVVDLTERQEKQANVLLNNPTVQMQFDPELLKPLLLEPDFDLGAAGFEPVELQIAFAGDADLAPLFNHDQTPEPSPEKRAKSKQRIQDLRKNLAANLAAEQDSEFYTVVVFRDRAQRERFMVGLGLEPSDKYVDGARVAHKAGITLEEA